MIRSMPKFVQPRKMSGPISDSSCGPGGSCGGFLVAGRREERRMHGDGKAGGDGEGVVEPVFHG